jgi:hypothetical protein
MLANVRASDADRDKVAAVLREAMAEGRIDLGELDERLTSVYRAKTCAQLAEVTRDLPDGYPTAVPDGGARPRRAIGFMGAFSRKGRWVVPGRMTALAFWGGGGLDMRKARFAERDTTIRAIAIMGGMGIVVPHNAEVHITGHGIMGGFGHGAAGPGAQGGPRITITGIAFWGGIGVKRKPSVTRAVSGPRG